MATRACPVLPSWPGTRSFSVAPNAAARKSMSWSTSFATRYGVTLRWPSGAALALIESSSSSAFAMQAQAAEPDCRPLNYDSDTPAGPGAISRRRGPAAA